VPSQFKELHERVANLGVDFQADAACALNRSKQLAQSLSEYVSELHVNLEKKMDAVIQAKVDAKGEKLTTEYSQSLKDAKATLLEAVFETQSTAWRNASLAAQEQTVQLRARLASSDDV
jgi:isocitrate/isopropylmalate dehydrogenase